MDKYCFNLILEGKAATVLLTWTLKQNLLNFAIQFNREQRPLIGYRTPEDINHLPFWFHLTHILENSRFEVPNSRAELFKAGLR